MTKEEMDTMKAKAEAQEKEIAELKKAQTDDAAKPRGMDQIEVGDHPSEGVLLSKSADPQVKQVQADYDNAAFFARVLKARNVDFTKHPYFARIAKRLEKNELSKSMTTGNTGYGPEWMPTSFSANIIDIMEQTGEIVGKFQNVFTVPQNETTLKIPYSTLRATVIKGSEGLTMAQIDALITDSGTATLEFTPREFAGTQFVSDNLTNDALAGLVPFLKGSLAKAIDNAEENTIINGDDSGSHMDGDITGSNDVRKWFKGLRKMAIAQATYVDFAGLLSATGKLLACIKKLGNCFKPANTVFIVGIDGRIQGLGLANALTKDLALNQASYFSGQVAPIYGCEVVCSEYCREDVSATGVWQAATQTSKGTILALNTGCFGIGRKLGVSIETERQAVRRGTFIMGTSRMDFKRLAASTQTDVCLGYDITLLS